MILEKDDFLREILGNLLHKNGYYIVSEVTLNRTLNKAKNHIIHMLIIGDTCDCFHGEESIHYIRKQLLSPTLLPFIISDTGKTYSFVEKENQIKISSLSIKQIINRVQDILE